MIMSMYKKICITNRHLVFGEKKTEITEKLWTEYYTQIEKALEKNIFALILREKDCNQNQYKEIAKKVISLCSKYQTKCILHSFVDTAIELKHPLIHLPLVQFLELDESQKDHFTAIGVSVHSVEEAKLAQKHGAAYLTAGHIFQTQCKKGVPPRGLNFLKSICEQVSIPVYAIGGIHQENVQSCIRQGADGICMMSEFFHKIK